MSRRIASRIVSVAAVSLLAAVPCLANHRAGKNALPEAMVAGDVDGDGHTDLCVLNTGFDHVAVLLGDGTGAMTLLGHSPADTLPNGMAGGDLNEDGVLDLVVTNIWGYNTLPLLGDGAGGFTQAAEYLSDEPDAVALDDFDRDGHLDLVVTNGAVGQRIVTFQAGDGRGGFGAPVTSAVLFKPGNLVSGDWNGDGNLDLAVAALNGNVVSIEIGDGTGRFADTLDVALTGVTVSISVGDLDEDGDLDLLVAGGRREDLFYAALLGDGAGHFTATDIVTIGSGSIKGSALLADLNGDHHLDLVIGPSTEGLPEVWMFPGDGHGAFGPKSSFPAHLEPHTIITADFNGDGHPDLAVSNRSTGDVTILLGDGAGGFVFLGNFVTF